MSEIGMSDIRRFVSLETEQCLKSILVQISDTYCTTIHTYIVAKKANVSLHNAQKRLRIGIIIISCKRKI